MADNALSALYPRKRNALEDLTQGVSRGFWADGMGGPVDLITTLANLGIAGGGYAGHKLGLLSQPPELIQNPVGGSEWIAQKMRGAGLLNDNPGSTADAYGRVAGGLLAPLTQARAPQIANALQQAPAALQRGAYAVGEKAAGMAENQLVRQGGILPATVWHGSPHKFDKFDASKIGTGEGAQAYGHGLYLAEAPDVAQSYKTVLAGKDGSAAGHASHVVGVYRGDADKALSYLKSIQPAPGETTYSGESHELIRDAIKAIQSGAYKSADTGSLYKVDLPDEHIAKMLDWDKPLSQQAPGVAEVVAKAFPGAYVNGRFVDPANSQLTGRALLDQLTAIANKRGAPGMRQAEPALKAAGIPGIRYLDGGSRTAGQGSSNFVVFPGNEGLLSILERNGQPIK